MKIDTKHMTKLDAGESVYFARELETIRPKLYNQKYPGLKGVGFLPVDTSLDPATEIVTFRSYDMTASAKIIASYASDFGRADVFAKEFTTKVVSIGSSYGYNLQEIRAARMVGRPLDQQKATASKRAIDQVIDLIAQTGDTATGLQGLLNLSDTQTYTIPSDATDATKDWTKKSSDQVARDMHTAVRSMVEATYELEQPDTIILPLTTFGDISTRRMSSIDSTTILEFFLKTSPYITTVASWYALETAGSGSVKRMVVYRRDPDALQFLLPIPFEQMPPEQRGFEFITMCHARCGGVVAYYPKSVLYADGM